MSTTSASFSPGHPPGGSQNPDPRGGWKKEVRDALERMQRVGKRLGDKAMQKYKDIMDRAAKALEEEAP